MAGFADVLKGLQGAVSNPMFTAGASIAQGGDIGQATNQMRRAQAFQAQQDRENQMREQWQQMAQSGSVPQGMAPFMQFMDPQQGASLLAQRALTAPDRERQAAMDQARLRLLQAQTAAQSRNAQGNDHPANVREWIYFSRLPPEKQQAYLTMRRSQPFLNLGDRFVQPNAVNPTQSQAEYSRGIAPERTIKDGRVIQMPGVRGGVSGAPQQPSSGVGGFAAPGLSGSAPFGPQITELPPSAEDRRKERGRRAEKIRAGTTVVQDLGRAMQMIPQMPDYSKADNIASATTRLFRSKVPGTPEYEIFKFKESALSNVGLDRLQQMRENSPTGGALGQVPFQQQQRLEQVLGALELGQSVPILEQNMKRIQNIYTDIMFGSSEERAALVRDGQLSPEENAKIEQRYHQLPFDDMGRPVSGQQRTAPSTGGWSVRKID